MTPRPSLPVLALVLAFAGCTSADDDNGGTTPPPPMPPGPPGAEVHAVSGAGGNTFDPDGFTTSPGREVTWDVVGTGHHTVTFLDPVDDAGTKPDSGDLGPGETFSVTFAHAGMHRYYCQYHADRDSFTGMVGTITVQ